MRKKNSRGYRYRPSYYHHVVPAVVWLTAVAVIVGLLYQRSKRFEVVGIAHGQVRHVAATCTARIKNIPVQLFEAVKEGQTVAIMDTVLDNEQEIEAQIKTQFAAASAEIKHLAAQLVSTQDTLVAEELDREVTRDAEMRRFLVDVENTRLRILELSALIASDQITLEDLAVEVKALQNLVQQDAAAPYELERIQVQYNSLAKKIQENQLLLDQAKADLTQTQVRCDEFSKRQFQHPSIDNALEVIRNEIKVQEGLVQGLLSQLEALKARRTLELKSPIDGIVIPIPIRANEALNQRPGEKTIARSGEVVNTGDPILAVAATEAFEIIAYISEMQSGLVQENGTVELIKSCEPLQIAQSQVTGIGPTMELMPQRLWRNPNIPQWGRPVLIKVPAGLKLIPGELVGIRGL
jgi:multidrug resistance efflux pump